MLTISPTSVSSVQAPTNETAEATVDHAIKLEPQTTASVPLNGIVPHGGLHPVARAASEVDSAAAQMQQLQQLQQLMTILSQILQQLQQQAQTGTSTGGATTNPTSNARAQDPMGQPMALLAQIMAQITKQ